MDDLIRRAREALVDVTPGQWKAAWESVDPEWAIVTGPGGGVVANVNDADQSAARFIAAARDLVPEMADRLEAQEALLREAMEVLHQYISDMRYPPERDSRDRRIAWAQATLAKLRAHMGDSHAK